MHFPLAHQFSMQLAQYFIRLKDLAVGLGRSYSVGIG